MRSDKVEGEKAQYLEELKTAYKEAVDKIAAIMKSHDDIRVFETEGGWDDHVDRLSGYKNEPLSAEDILFWLADYAPNWNSFLFFYTLEEIKRYRKNHALSKVDGWQKQIKYLQDEIKRYEGKIAAALNPEPTEAQDVQS